MRIRFFQVTVLLLVLSLPGRLYSQSKKPITQTIKKPPAQTVTRNDGIIGSTNNAQTELSNKTVQKNNPFIKGNWSWTHRTILDYTNYKEVPSQMVKYRSFSLVVDPSYFFLDHFAIGLDARVGSNYYNPPLALSKLSSWQANLTLTYARKINDKLNLYAKIAAGPGHSRSTLDRSAQQNAPRFTDADYFEIKATVGAPYSITEDGFGYVTPYFFYDNYKTKFTGQEYTTTGYSIGIRPQTYINYSNMKSSVHGDVSKSAYLKGKNFLENNSLFTHSHTRQVQSGFGDIVRARTNFYFGFGYYFLDNFAGGLNISVNRLATSNPGSPKSISSDWMIQPVFTAHLPVDNAAHNLFLQAAYGFGGGTQISFSDLFVKAGYNYFISKNLALTPKVGFERTTRETAIASRSGLAAEIGIRTWINFKSN